MNRMFSSNDLGGKSMSSLSMNNTAEQIHSFNTSEIDDLLYATQTGRMKTVMEVLNGKCLNPDIRIGDLKKPLLFFAVEGKQISLVRYFLDKGCRVNDVDDEGKDALMYAAGLGLIDIAKLLLDRGSSRTHFSIKQENALIIATKNSHDNMINLLLDNKFDINAGKRETALVSAVKVGNKKIIDLLLSRKASPNTSNNVRFSPLAIALHTNRFDTVHSLLTAKASIAPVRDTGVLFALEANRGDVAEVLIKHKANIHATNGLKDSTLAVAISHGHLNIATQLIISKADVNATNIYSEPVLMTGLETGNKEVVDLMVEHKASVSQINPNYRGNILELASQHNFPKILNKCLKPRTWNGIDDHSKKRAFILACAYGHFDVVQSLLNVGGVSPQPVSDNKQCYTNHTHPLHGAIHSGSVEILRFLLEKGCSLDDLGFEAINRAFVSNVKANNVDMALFCCNELNADVDTRDDTERNALMWAAANGNIELLGILISKGADINYVDPVVGSALTFAIFMNQDEAALSLIDHGINIHLTNADGANALTLLMNRNLMNSSIQSNTHHAISQYNDVSPSLILASTSGDRANSIISEYSRYSLSILNENMAMIDPSLTASISNSSPPSSQHLDSHSLEESGELNPLYYESYDYALKHSISLTHNYNRVNNNSISLSGANVITNNTASIVTTAALIKLLEARGCVASSTSAASKMEMDRDRVSGIMPLPTLSPRASIHKSLHSHPHQIPHYTHNPSLDVLPHKTELSGVSKHSTDFIPPVDSTPSSNESEKFAPVLAFTQNVVKIQKSNGSGKAHRRASTTSIMGADLQNILQSKRRQSTCVQGDPSDNIENDIVLNDKTIPNTYQPSNGGECTPTANSNVKLPPPLPSDILSQTASNSSRRESQVSNSNELTSKNPNLSRYSISSSLNLSSAHEQDLSMKLKNMSLNLTQTTNNYDSSMSDKSAFDTDANNWNDMLITSRTRGLSQCLHIPESTTPDTDYANMSQDDVVVTDFF